MEALSDIGFKAENMARRRIRRARAARLLIKRSGTCEEAARRAGGRQREDNGMKEGRQKRGRATGGVEMRFRSAGKRTEKGDMTVQVRHN